MLRRVHALLRWIDYLLVGEQPPRACEYRRPASITCYGHGQRKHA